jgi:hypothetical protein
MVDLSFGFQIEPSIPVWVGNGCCGKKRVFFGDLQGQGDFNEARNSRTTAEDSNRLVVLTTA